MRALHTAATGMMAQELNVQVISNNIANMRTTGYKRQRAEFQDLLYEHVRRVGTQTSDQGNSPAGRRRARLRREDRRHAAPDDARHAGADRQGLRRRDPRRRLLQDHAARRPHRLYARRLVRARRAGPHRHRAGQRACSPASPSRRTPTAVTDQRAGPGLGDAARQTTTPTVVGQIELAMFVNKAGLQAHRRQPVSRNARLRHAAGRQSRTTTASATCSRAISSRRTSRR